MQICVQAATPAVLHFPCSPFRGLGRGHRRLRVLRQRDLVPGSPSIWGLRFCFWRRSFCPAACPATAVLADYWQEIALVSIAAFRLATVRVWLLELCRARSVLVREKSRTGKFMSSHSLAFSRNHRVVDGTLFASLSDQRRGRLFWPGRLAVSPRALTDGLGSTSRPWTGRSWRRFAPPVPQACGRNRNCSRSTGIEPKQLYAPGRALVVSTQELDSGEYLGKLLLVRDALLRGNTERARQDPVEVGLALVANIIPKVQNCLGR
jgi:hypothetical protein